jgi:uncharacterized protein CbrC (UPF0167 family)
MSRAAKAKLPSHAKLEPLTTERPCRCRTCKRPTQMAGTRKCDYCYEVESRLTRYLIDGGKAARKFVAAALDRASALQNRKNAVGDAFDAGYDFYNEVVARPNRARRGASK